ncbi:MAG: TrkA C-terminal domain-containing protein [Candidatus Omnitrophica bacterium]|nr:TrkA C-terminal domain-containing protein [Candidatus Omnitrophota bacterium]
MAFLILAIPLILLVLIVEIAAIALHMTGLNMKSARFQALSAFTATGFTTKEAEDVVTHNQRRQIIMLLMIVGFITWASLISLIINAFSTHHELLPATLQVSALMFISLAVLFLSRYRPFVKSFRKTVSGYLENRTTLKKRSFDEVLRLAQNYGIAEITLTKESKNAGIKLKDANFREKDVLVLAIERNHKIIPAPGADDILMEGDTLICYGKLKKAEETA